MELDETFRQWTNQELDHQYSPSQWSHRMSATAVIQEHIQVLSIESEKAKQTVECDLDVSYGETEKQKLDIFGAKTLPQDAPIFVYVHGGYWQDLGREKSSFMAPAFTEAGAVVVALGYDLAPHASMNQMVVEIKRALAYVIKWAEQRGSRGVYLCGHSAGGHLSSMMMTVDWLTECNCDNLKGIISVAGVYDLRPLVKTYVNDPIKMTEENAWENSPFNHIQNMCANSGKRQVLIAVGAHDPPEFKRQSVQFYQELTKRSMNANFIEVEDKDHFDLIEDIRLEDFTLFKAIVQMMGLKKKTED